MTPVTERSALELARAIRSGELTSVEVVEAHIARHQAWAPRVNAVIADRFEAARAEAESADARVAAARAPAARSSAGEGELPLLLGVPFTVKESIAVAGMPNAAGLVSRGEHRAPASAPVVQRLLDAGAIALGVTNTSELTLWIESENRLYGRTSNPYDPSRAAGGSSGGEGAAVGCGGSPFGVAADVGGSIRIPAFFCGVFGHKPSSGAIPNTGLYPPASGDAGRMLQPGPIARRAEDLMPLLETMAGPDGEDPLARPIAFGDPASVSVEGLAVTVVEDSTFLSIRGAVRDARERALGALIAAGARVRTVSLPSWRGALLPFLMTLQDGNQRTTIELLEAAGSATPRWRDLLRGSGPHTLPTRMTLVAEMLPPASERASQRMIAAGHALAEEVREAIGDGVLLHPAHATVAPRHGGTVGRLWRLTPAAIFNLAGVPATEVPLGLDPQGIPLGVQVASGLDRDHVSIAVAIALERAFGGWVPPTL
jgi:fatty acid amide hydrolase 2